MASRKQQRLSDYIDAVHGGVSVGEHFSEADLKYDDDEVLAPSPKAPARTPAKAPAKTAAAEGQMEDAQKLLALTLELSRKRKASAQLTKHPLPKDMV